MAGWNEEAERGVQILDQLASKGSRSEAQREFDQLADADKRAIGLWGMFLRRFVRAPGDFDRWVNS